MIRILEQYDSFTLGWELSDEEASSISFAGMIYVNNIRNGLYTVQDVDPLVVHEGTEELESFVGELGNGSRVILDTQCEVIFNTIVPYFVRLFDGITSKPMLEGVCSLIGVRPDDFLENAVTACSMLGLYANSNPKS